MSIEQLILLLLKEPNKGQTVWVATDEEGNDFSPVRVVKNAGGQMTAAGDKVKGVILYP